MKSAPINLISANIKMLKDQNNDLLRQIETHKHREESCKKELIETNKALKEYEQALTLLSSKKTTRRKRVLS
jgi:cell division septum initiation protein DivIVA